jgi:UDP-N-acetylglucosamine 2-epimerase (non-hydrolysing)
VLVKNRPDIVVVYGDVNSTVAAALVCAKHRVPIAHVEAGLRSFDRSMPEEINRLMTDQVADWLFTPSRDGDANLRREGVASERIHFVGNIMIDTLVRLLPLARLSEGLALEDRYLLVTLHRPSNVDDPEMLRRIVNALEEISTEAQVVFPIHPRTRQRLTGFGWRPSRPERFRLQEPAGYLEFLALQKGAAAVVTDSGGIQEESTFLGVPCLTLRENTERPVTVETGTNQLLGRDMERLKREVSKVLAGEVKQGRIPELWDGKTAGRIAAILAGN